MSIIRPTRLLRTPGIIGTRADVVPTWPVEVDWTHPLTRNLVHASILGNTTRNLAGGISSGTIFPGAALSNGKLGAGLNTNTGTATGAYFSYNPKMDNTDRWLVFNLVSCSNWSSGNVQQLFRFFGTNQQGYQAQVQSGNINLYFNCNTGNNNSSYPLTGVTNNVPVGITCTLQNNPPPNNYAGLNTYVGSSIVNSSGIVKGVVNAGNAVLYVGGVAAGLAWNFLGITFATYVFMHQDSSILPWLNAEPFGFFRPILRKSYYTAPNVTSFAPSWLLEWV